MNSSAALRLDMNENPWGPSPKVVEAVKKEAGLLARYKDPRGEELKQALADCYSVSPEQITLNGDSGSFGLLFFVVRCFVKSKEDEIIFSREGFLNFAFHIQQLRDKYNIKTISVKDRRHDLDAIAKAVGPQTKLIFIVNPENPSGTWISHDELDRFLEKIPANVKVAVDEAYYEYARRGLGEEYPDSLALLDKYPNVIVIRTFSKAYGLAGLRVGYSVSRPETAAFMNAEKNLFDLNNPALAGAVAALEDQEHLRFILENNLEGLEYLQNALSQMKMDYIPSKAVNFVNIPLGKRAPLIFEKLAERSIAVNHTEAYNMPLSLRVSVGLPEQNRQFIETLADIL